MKAPRLRTPRGQPLSKAKGATTEGEVKHRRTGELATATWETHVATSGGNKFGRSVATSGKGLTPT
eukprot:3872712-Karenia_brevis.AAC.1